MIEMVAETFKKRKLKFSLKRYFAEISKLLEKSSQNDWYKKGVGKYDLLKTSFAFAKELELRRFYQAVWLKRFSGLIPAHWEYWRNIFTDLEKAEKSQIQLDSVMVDAAIMHPIFLVAKKAARCQRLNPHQLTWTLCRPFFSEANPFRQEVLTLQKFRKLSSIDIAKALSVSERVKIKLDKWYKRSRFPFVQAQTESLLDQEVAMFSRLMNLTEKLKNKSLSKEVKEKYLKEIKKDLEGNSALVLIIASLLGIA